MASTRALTDVLFLAYHFPPIGGAGAQRSVKFVRYLPEFGFRPVVVTGPNADASWPPRDATLAGEIPASVPVLRVSGALEPAKPSRWQRIRSRLLADETSFSRSWFATAVECGLRAAEMTAPRLIFATMSPFVSARVASFLAAKLGIPWVADLRDPWALDELFVCPTLLHRRYAVRKMHAELQDAAAIVMNTPEAAVAIRALLPEGPLRIVTTIPNGYDADDFAVESDGRCKGSFRIVHTGHVHAELGIRHRRTRWLRRALGGERVAVDLLPRSHYFVLEALRRWRKSDPAVSTNVKLVLAGATSEFDRMLVRESGVSDLVELTGYLDHSRSVELLRSADLLFLPMHALPPGERARIVPGKTYEYLAARRPILAAVPEGDARDLVLQSGAGDVCAPDDVDGMVSILKRRRREAGTGGPPRLPSDEFLRRFERRELTRQLAALFEAVGKR